MDFIFSLFNQITNTIDSLTSGIGDSIQSQLNQLNNTVSGIAGSVVDALGGELGYIQSTIQGAVGGIYAALGSQAQAIRTSLDGMSQHIGDELAASMRGITDTLSTVASGITNSIQNALGGLGGTLANIESWLANFVQRGLDEITRTLGGIEETVANTLAGAVGALQHEVSGLAESIEREIGNVVTGLQTEVGTIQDGITSAIASLQGEIGQVVSGIEQGIAGSIKDVLPFLAGINDAITKTFLPGAWIEALLDPLQLSRKAARGDIETAFDAKSKAVSKALKGEYASVDAFLADVADPLPVLGLIGSAIALFVVVPVLHTLVSIALAPLARRGTQEVNVRTLTEILDPATLAQAVVQGYKTLEQAAGEAALSGIDPGRFETLFNLAGEPPGLETILELWRRDFATEEQVTAAIRESRLKPKYEPLVKNLRFVLPPIVDLIRFGVREAFRDDVAGAFGYDEDFPQDVVKWLAQQGLDPDWMKRYWRAHWELPSVEQVFEMLHRDHETGMTKQIAETFLRVADIPKFWREKLLAISYNPFTRVDTRRMYKVGVLDREGVKRAYRDIGYDEARAEKLTDFTVKLEDEAGQLNPDARERRKYNALENLFERDLRTEADLESAMRTFGWPDDVIADELSIARYTKELIGATRSAHTALVSPAQLQRRIIDQLMKLYLSGRRTVGDLEAQMREFGYDDKVIALELTIANLTKESQVAPSRKDRAHELTVSAILEAMTLKAITEPEALSRLVGIGMTEVDAQVEIQLAKLEASNKIRAEIVRSLREAFLSGQVTEAAATTSLQTFGFSLTEVNERIAAWTIEKSLRHKSLSESQLAAFVRRGAMTPEEYVAELEKIGYNEQQIGWFLKLRGAA